MISAQLTHSVTPMIISEGGVYRLSSDGQGQSAGELGGVLNSTGGNRENREKDYCVSSVSLCSRNQNQSNRRKQRKRRKESTLFSLFSSCSRDSGLIGRGLNRKSPLLHEPAQLGSIVRRDGQGRGTETG